ncbi:hypothetical protein EK904_009895 [Melospiza melodia maxima]|nr:hypothetical protein EK904_009895 [Melospiza melodia maxima]
MSFGGENYNPGGCSGFCIKYILHRRLIVARKRTHTSYSRLAKRRAYQELIINTSRAPSLLEAFRGREHLLPLQLYATEGNPPPLPLVFFNLEKISAGTDSLLLKCSGSFKTQTPVSLQWYHCVVAKLIEILLNDFHTTDNFAETSSGKFYIPLNIPFKYLNTAHNLNGFAYNNREPYPFSRTFIYAGNSLDFRLIAGINLNGQPCFGLTFAVVQLSEKCPKLQKHVFKPSSLTAARLLQLPVPRADQQHVCSSGRSPCGPAVSTHILNTDGQTRCQPHRAAQNPVPLSGSALSSGKCVSIYAAGIPQYPATLLHTAGVISSLPKRGSRALSESTTTFGQHLAGAGDQKQVMHMSTTSTQCKQGDFQIYLNGSNPRISWTSLPCISYQLILSYPGVDLIVRNEIKTRLVYRSPKQLRCDSFPAEKQRCMTPPAQGCLAQFAAGGGKVSVGEMAVPPGSPQLFVSSTSQAKPGEMAMPPDSPQLFVSSTSQAKPKAACVFLYSSTEMETAQMLMRFVRVNPHVSLEFAGGSGYGKKCLTNNARHLYACLKNGLQ